MSGQVGIYYGIIVMRFWKEMSIIARRHVIEGL